MFFSEDHDFPCHEVNICFFAFISTQTVRSFHIGLSARWKWGSFTNFQVFFVWYSKLNLKNCSKTLSKPTKRVVLWVWFEIEAKYPIYTSRHENCLISKKNMSHIHIFEEKQWICYAWASRYPICITPNQPQMVLNHQVCPKGHEKTNHTKETSKTKM